MGKTSRMPEQRAGRGGLGVEDNGTDTDIDVETFEPKAHSVGVKEKEREDAGKDKAIDISISPPNFAFCRMKIIGVAPLVMNKFSSKAGQQMREKQAAGQKSVKGKKREPKDFQACYENAKHKFPDGTCGIPAPSFRNAMISACRICGFKMSQAKLAISIEADGFDVEDGTLLVRITKGEPKYHEAFVRNQSGVADIRARPMWEPGWEAFINMRFDADLFSADDVANLLTRAGMQVGILEGRPDSKKSCGMGWGLFRTAKNDAEAREGDAAKK